jgi:hypothetical protein
MFPAGCSHSGRPPPMSLRRTGGFLVGGGWQLLADQPGRPPGRLGTAPGRRPGRGWMGSAGIGNLPAPRVGGVSRCVWRGRPGGARCAAGGPGGGARRGWCAGRPTGWARWARRVIAQARVVGWRARLSLFSSTTPLAPKMAYSSSRRTTHAARRRWFLGREGAGVAGHNHRVQAGVAGRPLRRAAAIVRWRTALWVAGGHAKAVAGQGFGQRRPSGAQLGRGGVDAA